MSNNLTPFGQISAILNEIVSQATGKKLLTPVNRAEFITVAQTGLQVGYDPLLNAISQVMSRSIFSSRAYTGQLKGLRKNTQQYGNHVRKISYIDSGWTDNDAYKLEDGKSVDMYKFIKEKFLQMNFYGWNTYSREMMILREQMNVAFSGPEELGRFLAGKMTNVNNQINQGRETLARALVSNLIGGTCDLRANTESVIHLVTEFNNLNGTQATSADILSEKYVIAFAKFFYSRTGTIFDLLKERTEMFHYNVANKTVNRHSPKKFLKCYLISDFMNMLDASAHSEIYHNDYLKFMDYEKIAFWQAIKGNSRWSVSGKYVYNDVNGGVSESGSDTMIENVVGVIFDEEALGYTTFDQHVNRTPWNAAGDYAKLFWKYTDRYWCDFTENAVVLLLD